MGTYEDFIQEREHTYAGDGFRISRGEYLSLRIEHWSDEVERVLTTLSIRHVGIHKQADLLRRLVPFTERFERLSVAAKLGRALAPIAEMTHLAWLWLQGDIQSVDFSDLSRLKSVHLTEPTTLSPFAAKAEEALPRRHADPGWRPLGVARPTGAQSRACLPGQEALLPSRRRGRNGSETPARAAVAVAPTRAFRMHHPPGTHRQALAIHHHGIECNRRRSSPRQAPVSALRVPASSPVAGIGLRYSLARRPS